MNEVLPNGYIVIYKNDRLVLAYMLQGETYERIMGSKAEYASWKIGTDKCTHHGHYNTTLPKAMKDFEGRIKREDINLDHKEFDKCIEKHRMEVM